MVITWYFVESRNGNNDANSSGISLPALMLRYSSGGSKVFSGTISGGIANFSVKLYKGFTGSGNRQVELFINGVSKGESIAFDDFNEHVFSLSDINVSGDIVIRIDNITSTQVIVDDITWTAYAGILKPEPSNHITSFSAAVGTPSHNAIDITWVDATGSVLPDNYLIKGSLVSFDDISDPVDGIQESDGGLILNIAQGTQIATFTGLTESTTYYFKIWPYSNSETAIDYKTDGTIPVVDATTTANSDIAKIIIVRNCDPKENYEADRFAEIYNAGNETVDLTGWTLENIQNGAMKFEWELSGSINPGETKVCARSNSENQIITN